MTFGAAHVLQSLSIQLNPVPLQPGTQLLAYSNTREFDIFSRGGGALLSPSRFFVVSPIEPIFKAGERIACLGDTDKIQSLHS